ncbi:hypothetical protein ID858_17080, partial [Xenorhabdus sp. DI]|nr:hypothetical protein [Xenorhabdus sp. 3]MBD2790207.1 hypothetical protein [Xenorhabdus sp. DI]
HAELSHLLMGNCPLIGVDRGTDGEYDGHDEPERGAGQMVSKQVRADDDAKNPAQR